MTELSKVTIVRKDLKITIETTDPEVSFLEDIIEYFLDALEVYLKVKEEGLESPS